MCWSSVCTRPSLQEVLLFLADGKTSMSHAYTYGVATIRRLLKIIGLFCKRDLQKRPIFSKETCTFNEPTNRSHLTGRLGLFLWKRSLPLKTYTLWGGYG